MQSCCNEILLVYNKEKEVCLSIISIKKEYEWSEAEKEGGRGGYKMSGEKIEKSKNQWPDATEG